MFLVETNDGRLMETIKKNAQPYFERGYNAVMKQCQIRTFDETIDIIKHHALEYGFEEWWAECLACVFARSYMAGVVAASRLVAPDLAEQVSSCADIIRMATGTT